MLERALQQRRLLVEPCLAGAQLELGPLLVMEAADHDIGEAADDRHDQQ